MPAHKELLDKVNKYYEMTIKNQYGTNVYKLIETAIEGEYPIFDESMCRALLTLDYPLNACAKACEKNGANNLDEMAECILDYTQGLATKFYQRIDELGCNIVNEFLSRLQGYYLVDYTLQDDFRYAAYIYDGSTRAASIERQPLRLLLHEDGTLMRNVKLLFESVKNEVTRDYNNALPAAGYENDLEDAEEPEL